MARSRLSSWAIAALGALIGGLAGPIVVVGVVVTLKKMIAVVSAQPTPIMIASPIVGLALAVLVLRVFGHYDTPSRRRRGAPHGSQWTTFPRGAVQADITGDVIATAGEEEHFPWHLAPIRTLAIFATVGFGAAMGTEAPAAYLGVAAGAFLLDRGRWWRRLLRPAALGGGAAGVSALMGIPLVGTAYLLELGRRHHAPLDAERVIAALVGGFAGWAINVWFHLDLIRLVVPHQAPNDIGQAVLTALFIGGLSGAITSFAGAAIYRAKEWHASPGARLALGGLATVLAAVTLAIIASPSTAVGPGSAAIAWAEQDKAIPTTMLAVALLRATLTTAAVAAGGCGGVFVPFLAIGDLSGRVFAPGLGIGHDLAGAAGAAGGIAGGYHLPFTAMTVVFWLGGPHLAVLTCLATIGTAYFAGAGVTAMLDRLKELAHARRPSEVH
jgi:H+/Cl- antiporter ClcA